MFCDREKEREKEKEKEGEREKGEVREGGDGEREIRREMTVYKWQPEETFETLTFHLLLALSPLLLLMLLATVLYAQSQQTVGLIVSE